MRLAPSLGRWPSPYSTSSCRIGYAVRQRYVVRRLSLVHSSLPPIPISKASKPNCRGLHAACPLYSAHFPQRTAHHTHRRTPRFCLDPYPTSLRSYFLTFLLLGLALTHHGMTLLLIPGSLLTLWLRGEGQQERLLSWRPMLIIGALLATVLPLVLYLYIPLRSGPAASPWYHQRLGTETLVLYQNNWRSFVDFIAGRSISVGFHSWQAAIAKLPDPGCSGVCILIGRA